VAETVESRSVVEGIGRLRLASDGSAVDLEGVLEGRYASSDVRREGTLAITTTRSKGANGNGRWREEGYAGGKRSLFNTSAVVSHLDSEELVVHGHMQSDSRTRSIDIADSLDEGTSQGVGASVEVESHRELSSNGARRYIDSEVIRAHGLAISQACDVHAGISERNAVRRCACTEAPIGISDLDREELPISIDRDTHSGAISVDATDTRHDGAREIFAAIDVELEGMCQAGAAHCERYIAVSARRSAIR